MKSESIDYDVRMLIYEEVIQKKWDWEKINSVEVVHKLDKSGKLDMIMARYGEAKEDVFMKAVNILDMIKKGELRKEWWDIEYDKNFDEIGTEDIAEWSVRSVDFGGNLVVKLKDDMITGVGFEIDRKKWRKEMQIRKEALKKFEKNVTPE